MAEDLNAVNAAYRRLACAILINWMMEYWKLKRRAERAKDPAMATWYQAKRETFAESLLVETAAHRMADLTTDKIKIALERIDSGDLDPRNMRRVLEGR